VLEQGRAISGVVESIDPTGTRRIVGFGVNAFVSEAFAAELRSGVLPHYTTCLLERHQAGKSPILSREAIRSGNAGHGLTFVSLGVGHIGPDEVSPDVFHTVMGAMLASSQAAHRGYNICEAVVEVCGVPMRDFLVAGGFRLRSDYREAFPHNPPPSEQHPYLLGITRAEAVTRPFDTFSFWFHYNRPRFHLTASQQETLRHAMAGETDEDLARSLSISPWTVKKRWQAIYSAVESVSPDLLPPESDGDTDGPRHTRGTERRRHLLHYLREHMEELRP
jgi:hypothetical protein